jgi:TonB family protein
MMTDPKEKTRRRIALFISVFIHAGLIYFIATSALDFLTPEGVVTQMEFSGTEVYQGEETAQQKEVVLEKASTPPPPKSSANPPPAAPPQSSPESAALPDSDPATETEAGDLPINKDSMAKTLPDKVETAQELPQEVPATTPPSTDNYQANEKEFLKDDMADSTAEPTAETNPDTAIENPNDTTSENVAATPVPENAGLPDAPPPPADALPAPAGMRDGTKVFSEGQIKPSQQPKFGYPRTSQFMKEEGDVVMEAHVNPDGSIEKIRLLKSSGFERLDDAALERAASDLKFPAFGERFIFQFGASYKLTGTAKSLQNREAEKILNQKK